MDIRELLKNQHTIAIHYCEIININRQILFYLTMLISIKSIIFIIF